MPKKYMDDYNYHDWTQFMVDRPEKKPKGPHFAAVLFDTRTEWMPAYDSHDSDSSSTVPDIHYFAFPDKETLGEWVLRAARDKKNFFFFEVRQLGNAQLQVSVDLGLGSS
jgi:hypothetical protein